MVRRRIWSVAASHYWIYLRNTIPDLPKLSREGDLLERIYWNGREKQTSREPLIKIAGPFVNFY